MKKRSTADIQRLFIALKVPSELGKKITQYEKELPFWRWYSAKELHMTIRFIGETPGEKVEELVEAFEQGFTDQRMVRFTTLGYGFNPSERKASSMHLRMQCSHAMEELKAKADAVCPDGNEGLSGLGASIGRILSGYFTKGRSRSKAYFSP